MTTESLTTRAYREIRAMILRLDLAPGAMINEGDLQDRLGIGRTPVREAIQRLTRDQLLTVIPRRGVTVTGIDPDELPLLYETRALMEPHAARQAALRGTTDHWEEMGALLATATHGPSASMLDVDRRCHEIVWDAAGNRFLTGTLDMLYAQSERVWHLYLADVSDMSSALDEHREIYDTLRTGDADSAAALTEAHVRSFDRQIRTAVRGRPSGSKPT